MKINCHYRLGRQFQDPLEAMDGWKGAYMDVFTACLEKCYPSLSPHHQKMIFRLELAPRRVAPASIIVQAVS